MAAVVLDSPLQVVEVPATPANPPTGSVEFYAKVDGNLYQLTSAGVETKLSGGSSSAVPINVASGTVYTIAANTQVLYAVPLVVDGSIVNNGVKVWVG